MKLGLEVVGPDARGFETDRLSIRPLVVSDADELFESLSDSRLYEFIPQDPPTLEALQTRYAKLQTRLSPDGTEHWLNWVMRAGAQPIGTLEATVLPDHSAFIAYMVFTHHQRQGYASEGCRWLIEHLREAYGVTSVKASVDTRNVASIRLLESLGFEKAKLVANADFFKGTSSDEFLFRLTLAQ